MVITPYTDPQSPLTCLHLGAKRYETTWAENKWHEGCVIRNCYVDCAGVATAKDVRGIVVSGGQGSIVEGNQILNCKYGGPYWSDVAAELADQLPNKDVVVRENYFYNIIVGVSQKVGSGANSNIVMGRLNVHNNVFELALSGATGETDPTAIRLEGASSMSPKRFPTFIARANTIRPKDNDSTTAATRYGITFDSCGNAIIEENVIDLGQGSGGANPPNNAVLHDNSVDNVTVFNNRKQSGELLPGFNEGNSTHDWELSDEAESAFLGL